MSNMGSNHKNKHDSPKFWSRAVATKNSDSITEDETTRSKDDDKPTRDKVYQSNQQTKYDTPTLWSRVAAIGSTQEDESDSSLESSDESIDESNRALFYRLEHDKFGNDDEPMALQLKRQLSGDSSPDVLLHNMNGSSASLNVSGLGNLFGCSSSDLQGSDKSINKSSGHSKQQVAARSVFGRKLCSGECSTSSDFHGNTDSLSKPADHMRLPNRKVFVRRTFSDETPLQRGVRRSNSSDSVSMDELGLKFGARRGKRTPSVDSIPDANLESPHSTAARIFGRRKPEASSPNNNGAPPRRFLTASKSLDSELVAFGARRGKRSWPDCSSNNASLTKLPPPTLFGLIRNISTDSNDSNRRCHQEVLPEIIHNEPHQQEFYDNIMDQLGEIKKQMKTHGFVTNLGFLQMSRDVVATRLVHGGAESERSFG